MRSYMENIINTISTGSNQELFVDYIQYKTSLLKVLTFMDSKGLSNTDAFHLGALAYNSNFTKHEILEALDFNDQSYRDALKKLKAWIAKWNYLTQENLEAA